MSHFTPNQQAAFDRWVDITAQLLQEYGPAFLAKQGEKLSSEEQPIPAVSTEKREPLESLYAAA